MKNYIIQISIHVPSWGTTVSVFRIRSINEFQSTFPRGERPVPGHVVSDFIRISIHVPSWGTTIPGLMVSALLSLFQSTFPRGERPSRRSSFSLESDFNPRSLVGNDQVDQASLQYVQNFNPRSLVGNDTSMIWSCLTIRNFNPRSLVGNDFNAVKVVNSNNISIHVPSWGTTLFALDHGVAYLISIHVPSWGTTRSRRFYEYSGGFQSTFPRGERLQIFTNILCFFMQ